VRADVPRNRRKDESARATSRQPSRQRIKRRVRLWAIRRGHYRLYRAILFRTEREEF
jgi:hypothetical protein